MREYERAPRKYELMTILHPEVAEEALPGELDRISGYISTVGGELTETLQDSPWGRRRLAYPIRSGGRDVRDGYYTVWHFEVAPTQITELERELKLNEQVIRYIVVSWEPKPLGPKEIEAAEIAAEDAAAAEYAAAQDAAAEEYEAAQAAAAAAAAGDADGTETQAATESASEPAVAASTEATADTAGADEEVTVDTAEADAEASVDTAATSEPEVDEAPAAAGEPEGIETPAAAEAASTAEEEA